MNRENELTTQAPTRRSCRVDGCPCEDVRIVSRRRASFFAALARGAGQTANRVIAPEAGWQVPAAGNS